MDKVEPVKIDIFSLSEKRTSYYDVLFHAQLMMEGLLATNRSIYVIECKYALDELMKKEIEEGVLVSENNNKEKIIEQMYNLCLKSGYKNDKFTLRIIKAILID